MVRIYYAFLGRSLFQCLITLHGEILSLLLDLFERFAFDCFLGGPRVGSEAVIGVQLQYRRVSFNDNTLVAKSARQGLKLSVHVFVRSKGGKNNEKRRRERKRRKRGREKTVVLKDSTWYLLPFACTGMK